MSIISFNPVFQLKAPPRFRASISSKPIRITDSLDKNSRTTVNKQQPQQLNLSVLRFTFGIPGLDESYLPRWIGYGFGSLTILNHFVGSGSITVPQLRSEALGLSLAAFSIALPYIGKFLKGSTLMDQGTLPEGANQIFVMSPNISDSLKEELAWATYILLRNTNTVAVLISVQGELCVRGYWNPPDNASKAQIHDWFKSQIENMGLSDLKETLYLPQSPGYGLREMLPEGTRSLLVHPVIQARSSNPNEVQKNEGFVLVASSIGYAYSDSDRGWIGAIANKFRGMALCMDFK